MRPRLLRSHRPLLLVAALVLAGCRDEVRVVHETTVFEDAGLEVALTVVGRTSEGEVPDEPPDWLESEGGVRLAVPDAWSVDARSPARLAADAYFASSSEMPNLLEYRDELGWQADEVRTDVWTESRVLMRCWFFDEVHPDPGGLDRLDRALATLAEATTRVTSDAAKRHFGDGTDTSGVEAAVRERVLPLWRDLLLANLALHRSSEERRVAGWRRVLREHGVPVDDAERIDAFFERQAVLTLDWFRERVAAALRVDGVAPPAESLTFVPGPENFDERVAELVRRTYGDSETVETELEPAATLAMAYVTGEDGALVTIDRRLRMPGTRIRTTGLPAPDETLWLIRGEDRKLGELRLQEITGRTEPEALRALGVRREFGPGELLELHDLLWNRDPEARLVPLLEEAVRAQDPEVLLDDERIPEGMQDVVARIYRFLEPPDDER